MTEKQKRERKARKALEQRVSDIVSGACGYSFGENDDWLNAAQLSRALPALKAVFKDDKRITQDGFIYAIGSLDNFDNVQDITNWLYENGVRA